MNVASLCLSRDICVVHIGYILNWPVLRFVLDFELYILVKPGSFLKEREKLAVKQTDILQKQF